ncbi:CDC45-like protein [Cryptosporidium canis]|uniref:CDC45-like protein n=1 Tax=Cryptosporidium canis TaxID=195482 RepID=A0ABQ8P7F6_9CRYT|nr:CDC45-like protein [Cryptosporidium canis]KAJ1615075.1 CDC45-like protein [Cryptosporidium canis]
MPAIPAADFVSQYYLPFVEKTQVRSNNPTNQAFPKVWIFSSNDVDSLCTSNILINQFFKYDEIHCMLNCVTHYNEISKILQEYKNYPSQRESVNICVLVNLGAIVNILHSLRLWLGEDLEIWVFDFHRPVLDEFTFYVGNEYSNNNILVLSIQEYNFMMNSKSGKKKSRKSSSNISSDKLNESSLSQSNPFASLSQTIDDLDLLMGTSNSDSQCYNEQIEDEVDELFGEYCGDPSSLVILQTLDNSTTSERIDGNVLWYSSIGISWCFINRYIEPMDYELYFDLLNGILSKYTSEVNNRSSKKNKSRKYWPKYIKNDLSIPLYRHWNLLDSVYHSELLFSRMGLWKGENKRDSIMNRRVASGISLKDFTSKFYLLENELSKKVVQDFPKGFSGFESVSETTSQSLQVPVFLKYLPSVVLDSEIHPHISSLDMAQILHTLLTNDCRLADSSESFMDAIVSSGALDRMDLKNNTGRGKLPDDKIHEKENMQSYHIFGKDHKVQFVFRDCFRVGLQLLDLSGTNFNQINIFQGHYWRHLKCYIEEAKLLLSLKLKYVKMLLSSSTNGGTLIKHNYFAYAELNDIEISHPLNLRAIGHSLIDIISRSRDLQDKLVIVSRNSTSKVATIVGITPGFDSNSPNLFGSIFSKVIDIILNESQGILDEDHFFVQDEFDFSILRIHTNFLDQFTSNLFKYIESSKHILSSSI